MSLSASPSSRCRCNSAAGGWNAISLVPRNGRGERSHTVKCKRSAVTRLLAVVGFPRRGILVEIEAEEFVQLAVGASERQWPLEERFYRRREEFLITYDTENFDDRVTTSDALEFARLNRFPLLNLFPSPYFCLTARARARLVMSFRQRVERR